ncbi:unnamed protein product [Caenorhabditis nigoni]
MSKLLPSLQSIKILYKMFSEQFQFSKFCNSLPNLRVLDISYADDLTTLEGIEHLKNLQKLVMRCVRIEEVNGYKALSELKCLRYLDVSECDDNPIIRRFLEDEVRMENLDFLDCSMTCVQEHELEEFVKHHPKLKTVVAISTACDQASIPTICLLNFLSTDSTLKSLEYAITNELDDLVEYCLNEIMEKLENLQQLNDSESRGLLNAIFYVLREINDESAKDLIIQFFAESNFFENERFFNSFWLEIPGILELIFKSWEHLNCSEIERTTVSSILSIFERVVNSLKFGKVLQEKLLNFIMEKTIELSYQYPENIREVTSILIKAPRLMSVHQHTAMRNNMKVIEVLFDFAHRLIKFDPSSYQQIMENIVRYLNQASKNTLNYLISNCQAVEKCYEHVMIIFYSPSTDSQNNLSKIVLRLMSVLNLNNPDEKVKALTSCTILSLLLAKNLIDDREYVNTIIGEFNDSWGRSKILAYQNITGIMYALFTSEYSTDESIRFGLLLTSTFVNAKICESVEYWNWVRTTLEYIRNSEKCTKKTRESASSVLYEMTMINMK